MMFPTGHPPPPGHYGAQIRPVPGVMYKPGAGPVPSPPGALPPGIGHPPPPQMPARPKPKRTPARQQGLADLAHKVHITVNLGGGHSGAPGQPGQAGSVHQGGAGQAGAPGPAAPRYRPPV